MLKFNRSLSTVKLVHEIFYMTFDLNDRAVIFAAGATGQINMSLKYTIHYMETRGSSDQGLLIENDFI